MNYPGLMPGGLSSDSYVEKHLRQLDAEHYSAAGVLCYRRTGEGVELLLPRERPWNSFMQAYDPIALNVFGGKRVPRQERSAETTGVRCFVESVGQVEGAPDTEGLYAMLQSSFVVWYAMGKFALLVCEVPEGGLAELPEKFAAAKSEGGPAEEYKMLPTGIKKYIKQIESLEWIPASRLVPAPQSEVADLLSNMLQISGFREFLEGSLDPATAWPESANPPPAWAEGGKPDSKGARQAGGCAEGGKGDAKGFKGKGFKGGYKGYKGGGKGYENKGWKGWGNGKGCSIFSGKGGKMDGGKGMGMYGGKPMGSPYPAGGMPMGPMVYPSYEQNPVEMQRQVYGEQLYVLVQPMSPSPYLAQKITGMLLELPQNELLLNLTNQEELHRRVQEALEVLKEDGVMP